LNRQDFQHLALIRLEEVRVLLNNNQFSGAYYLSGYVVECALKACIAKNTREFDFPDKETVIDSYTHNLVKLVRVAKLDEEIQSRITNLNFSSQWLVIKKWSEISRYKIYSKQEADDIYLAISDPK
jgi:HEPN domain-containing protein